MGVEVDEGDLVDLYVGALATFGTRIQQVTSTGWANATPCDDWTIRELVAHVVFGEAQLVEVLKGAARDSSGEFDVELIGENPLATWRGTALQAIAAVKEGSVFSKVFDLDLGEVPGSTLVGFRITENIVHGWDLSVALGGPIPIQENYADWLLEFWWPSASDLGKTNLFGEPVMPAEGSDSSTRLLALLGRTASP